ncbi:MAG: hypothetical protein ACXWPK_19000 [Isosphaeraceae bacterium]|jgi:hypothetical protein
MCPHSRGQRQPGSPRLSSVLVLFLLLLGLLAAGCSEELGPERFPTTRVAGIVVEGGRPVAGGWIEFIPTDGTVGNIRSARIGRDGSFQADRVAIGENVIRLVNAPINMPGGEKLFGQFSSPVRRKIPLEPDGPLAIDLLEEAVRYQATRPRPAAHSASNFASGAEP